MNQMTQQPQQPQLTHLQEEHPTHIHILLKTITKLNIGKNAHVERENQNPTMNMVNGQMLEMGNIAENAQVVHM